MSQNDFTIANQGFPAFRADLNSALQALASNNSGATEPTTMFANMWWYDSANNIMYIRNEDNDAWIKFAELDQTNDKFVLSGTLQLDDGTVSAPALTFNSDTNMGIYRGGTDILKFVTAGTDAVTIDSSQNLLVGTTNSVPGAGNTAVGASIYNDGRIFLSKSANTVASFNRNTSDGAIAEFRKDGSAVGSIGSISGTGVSLISTTGGVQVGSSDAGFNFNGAGNYILPWNVGANTSNDGGIDLGASSHRFKNLYLSGGVYLGGTGSANYLDDYEEGTFTPVYEGSGTSGTRTVGSSEGFYTKIGNSVTVWVRITNMTLSGGTGALKISGMPFASSHGSAAYGAGALAMTHNIAFNTSRNQAFYIVGTSLFAFESQDSAAWVDLPVTNASGIYINYTVTYRTT